MTPCPPFGGNLTVPGWSWTALSDRWDEGFARLLAYTAEHGHALVPQLHVDKTGFRLGTWVATQRTRYTSNSLSTDRIERLESVDGWAWNPHVYQWESGFSRLVAYVDQHGHACVPQSYIDESGFRLGVWVLTQRRRKIKGAISDEQVERLEGLPDWTWNAKQ
ncbi:helicase associated domain-containing protein [Nocardia cyriacigeorgica]|uniref:helicase associated domain-containing protein n=1 Tax=Nocardia cyriacigeorgica TaxID=135487 RepID=UPI003CC7F6B3